ncbi:4-carboxymuconolactone decarboxylase [Rhodococcus sp. EPR-157]|uniref:carboxymuconolactone decarboxylase family protein n=1 Tax=Rhodococcus sp. EPR-157 TaxID=1813677 RepID=UPI0007BB9891|nr:carboxymuconolactone decarboxylase family protein [Rhodococcus sp. EPR-157]KZF13237.1 4-carboxymuconolactone decarboxylase [Rhodococcus sp. EPR-157]
MPDDAPTPGLAQGIAVRSAVMGAEFVQGAFDRARETESEDIQSFVTEHIWGALWSRPQLDRAQRSLVTIGMLTALRSHDELRGHVRGALTNGLSREQITEAILHAVGYCGAPAALAAMRVVQQVFDESNNAA